MRLESQFSRMNCQMFSTGLSSGDFAGRGSRVMFLGTVSLAERCQPARAFVWMQGHVYQNFNNYQVQLMLLRGIAWAAKHPVDELVDYKPTTPTLPPPPPMAPAAK